MWLQHSSHCNWTQHHPPHLILVHTCTGKNNNQTVIMIITNDECSIGACYLPVDFDSSAEVVVE